MPKVQVMAIGVAVAMMAGSGSACGDGLVATAPDTAVKNGDWGARGIVVRVKPDGGDVEYDCGRGTIDAALKLDSGGRFNVTGRHFREGGPTRLDEKGEPARYSGRVEGDTMTLSVSLPDSRTTLGPYTLTFGQQVILRKCL